MRTIAFFICLLCLTVQLLADEAPPQHKPLLVFSGADSHVTEAECHRIDSAAQWQELWLRHLGLRENTIHRPVLEVDLDQSMLIAVFRGVRKNIASIRVAAIDETDETITLRLQNIGYQTGSTDESGGAQQVTPYAFIALPNSDKEIVLQENVQSYKGHPPQWQEFARIPARKP